MQHHERARNPTDLLIHIRRIIMHLMICMLLVIGVSAVTPITDSNIKGAVLEWCTSPAGAEQTYGHISGWDVSDVQDMDSLFCASTGTDGAALLSCSIYKAGFNDDISKWDVSEVTTME